MDVDVDGTANRSSASGKHRNHVSAINAANATILKCCQRRLEFGVMNWSRIEDGGSEDGGPLQYFFIVLIIGCNAAN